MRISGIMCLVFLSINLLSSTIYKGTYVIITPDEFYHKVQNLATWRAQVGFDVEVIKLSEIGQNPSPDEIRNWIFSHDPNWTNRPVFIVLVGDVEWIPVKYWDDDTTCAFSDQYYTLSSTGDTLSDRYIGRLSVHNEDELEIVINKIINYERNPPSGD